VPKGQGVSSVWYKEHSI